MSAMSNLELSIRDALNAGDETCREIATRLEVPISWVHEVLSTLCQEDVDEFCSGYQN